MKGLREVLPASIFAIALLAAFSGCGKGESAPPASIGQPTAEDASKATVVSESSDSTATTPASVTKKAVQVNLYPEVLIKTSLGEIRVKLNAEKSPLTVENFLDNYVRRGFYNGTVVHYVAADSMLAAGGFTDKFEAKETRAPIMNEAANGLKNKKGTLAMARDPMYAHSATSQFFVNLVDNPSFDHAGTESSEEFGYCVFGEVIAGQSVIDAIAKTAVHDQGDFVSTPVEAIVIESIEQVK